MSEELQVQDMERELKLALGGEKEFQLWRQALGKPDRVLKQMNFYLQISEVGTALGRHMLRLRALCPENCEFSSCALNRAISERSSLASALSLCPLYSRRRTPFVATFKTLLHSQSDNRPNIPGYFETIELEEELDCQQVLGVLSGDLAIIATTKPGKYLSERGFSSCRFQGILSNTRLCYKISDWGIWELDLSRFSPTRCDSEIEIETAYPEQALAELKNYARVHNLPPFSLQEKTKYERFLETHRAIH